MKNLYHPILKIRANVNNSVWRCDDEIFCWAVSGDINKRKALWFIYPPEIIADELREHLVNSKIFDRNEVIEIIEKYI